MMYLGVKMSMCCIYSSYQSLQRYREYKDGM
jgi:hypothetical protein